MLDEPARQPLRKRPQPLHLGHRLRTGKVRSGSNPRQCGQYQLVLADGRVEPELLAMTT